MVKQFKPDPWDSVEDLEVVGRRMAFSRSGRSLLLRHARQFAAGISGLLARWGYLCRLKRDNFPVAVLFHPNPCVANVATEWFPVDCRFYGI